MKEGRKEGQVMAENEGKGDETNTRYKETIKARNRREDDAWIREALLKWRSPPVRRTGKKNG